MAAISVASVTYLWSDDLKQFKHQWIDMPAQTIAAAEPHNAVHSSEAVALPQNKAGSPSPTVQGVPNITRVHTPAKQQYRVIAIMKGPPREAILQSEGIECIYRLGDIVPGWGVIIAITDRSVLSMKEQLALMNDSSGPSHELRHSSSAEPCTSIAHDH
ncbi:MAG: hypothetical protein H0W13_01380 [Nitrospirales bacterium]|nr:hypothetical protein [Nitrospirales bacterium]